MRAHGVTIVLTTPGTANPLTYCSEGVRAALVPEVPHIAPWICLVVLAGATVLFTATGIKGFMRRAIE